MNKKSTEQFLALGTIAIGPAFNHKSITALSAYLTQKHYQAKDSRN